MHILGIPILSLLIFFPIAGAIVLLFINKEKAETLRVVTLILAIVEFIVSLPLFFAFDSKTAAMQFVEDWWWVEAYGISYKLGIDGISLFLVLLTTFSAPGQPSPSG
jgi:NADH-quinone oxidoreductase subunit M